MALTTQARVPEPRTRDDAPDTHDSRATPPATADRGASDRKPAPERPRPEPRLPDPIASFTF